MKKRTLLVALLVVPMGIALAQYGAMPSGLSDAPKGLWEKDASGRWVLKTPEGGWKQGGVEGYGSGGQGPKKDQPMLPE